MTKKNWVKDFLESSPWALGAIALAAVLTFLLTAIDQGWRVWERFRATKEVPAMEIARLSAFVLAPVTPEMREVPEVRSIQELSGMFRDMNLDRVPLWPVQLLVMNPTKETINLHSCRMRVTLPPDAYKGIKAFGPLESREYFFSDAIASLETRAAGKPIAVAPSEAKRVQLYFLFVLLDRLRINPEKKNSAFWTFENPTAVVVTCRDQARRELSGTSTIYGSIIPRAEDTTTGKPPAPPKPPSKKME